MFLYTYELPELSSRASALITSGTSIIDNVPVLEEMGDQSCGIEGAGKQDGDTSYYCEDFEWEDLRNEIETKSEHQCQYPDTIKFSEAVEEASNKDAWQSFHQRHSTGTFFKERKYLLKEFPELLRADDNARVLEVGCGSGSSVLPILRYFLQPI